MGRPRKEAMDKLLIGVMFFMLIGLSVVHESRLKKVEAATYSAQQPKERDTFAFRNNGVWVLTSADTAVINSNGSTKRIISLYYSK